MSPVRTGSPGALVACRHDMHAIPAHVHVGQTYVELPHPAGTANGNRVLQFRCGSLHRIVAPDRCNRMSLGATGSPVRRLDFLLARFLFFLSRQPDFFLAISRCRALFFLA
jgi:hypothetical protein